MKHQRGKWFVGRIIWASFAYIMKPMPISKIAEGENRVCIRDSPSRLLAVFSVCRVCSHHCIKPSWFLLPPWNSFSSFSSSSTFLLALPLLLLLHKTDYFIKCSMEMAQKVVLYNNPKSEDLLPCLQQHTNTNICNSLPEVSIALVFLIVAFACGLRWAGLLYSFIPEANIRVLSITPDTAVHHPARAVIINRTPHWWCIEGLRQRQRGHAVYCTPTNALRSDCFQGLKIKCRIKNFKICTNI